MGIRQPLNRDGTMTCRKCSVPKPTTTEHFAPIKNTKSGLSATCRECWRTYHQGWKADNKERTAPRRRTLYYERHAEAQQAKRLTRLALYPLRVRAGVLRQGMIDRSRSKSLRFDGETLTIAYIMGWIERTPACPCCQFPIDYGYKGLGQKNDRSPSIDRIIPNLGYVIGNVALICWRCNNLKRDATPDELETIARWMRSHESPPEYPDR